MVQDVGMLYSSYIMSREVNIAFLSKNVSRDVSSQSEKTLSEVL